MSIFWLPKIFKFRDAEEALSTFRLIPEAYGTNTRRYGEAISLDTLGVTYAELSQPEKALSFLQQALTIAREIGDRATEAQILNHIGEVLSNTGKQAEASSVYQQALTIRQEVGDRAGIGATLNNLGVAYLKSQQYSQAETQLFAAIEVWEFLRPGLTAEFLNADALLGVEATESKVLQAIESSRIVHIATHGLLEDVAGLGVPGALALAPSSEDRGFLTSSEILDLNLSAELVVLSACDTAQGDIKSDGVIGLSRSFIAAGTPSIIVTLWKIPDDATAFLMNEFYQQLDSTGDKAVALRRAMLATMKQFPDPENWAAPTLIGEAE